MLKYAYCFGFLAKYANFASVMAVKSALSNV